MPCPPFRAAEKTIMAHIFDRRTRPRVPTILGQHRSPEELDDMLTEIEGFQRRLQLEKSAVLKVLDNGETKPIQIAW